MKKLLHVHCISRQFVLNFNHEYIPIFDMFEKEKEEVTVLCIASISSSREWIHPINIERNEFGEFQNSISQRIDDNEQLKWYYRITKTEFYHLPRLVGPKIKKCSLNLG